MIERAQVLKLVDLQIRVLFEGKSEVIQFLIKHERKNHFVDLLMAELWKVGQKKVLKKPAHLAALIKDFTNMFSKAALLKAEQNIISANERTRRIEEHNKIENAEQIANELLIEEGEIHREV